MNDIAEIVKAALHQIKEAEASLKKEGHNVEFLNNLQVESHPIINGERDKGIRLKFTFSIEDKEPG